MRKPCDSGSVLAEGHRSRLCSLLALITSFFFFSFSPHAGGSYIGPERWVNELLCFCVCVCVCVCLRGFSLEGVGCWLVMLGDDSRKGQNGVNARMKM